MYNFYFCKNARLHFNADSNTPIEIKTNIYNQQRKSFNRIENDIHKELFYLIQTLENPQRDIYVDDLNSL